MATSLEYVEFVCDRIKGAGDVRFKKMFGEYMVYVNNKPLLLVCDDTVYVKKLDALGELMRNAPLGMPYNGAKEHYILDIDDDKLTRSVIDVLEPITPIPAPRNKKAAKSAAWFQPPSKCRLRLISLIFLQSRAAVSTRSYEALLRNLRLSKKWLNAAFSSFYGFSSVLTRMSSEPD